MKPLIQQSAVKDALFRKSLLILAAILTAVLISLFPTLFNDFTNWDDQFLLTKNPLTLKLDWSHIKETFTNTVEAGYTPLTILSFTIERHFFGLNPFVYHLDNLLLHMMIVALIFSLALRMELNVWAAGISALLFGIHPMHVESVAWIAERKDVLYAIFYMLAIHSYWTYLKKKSWISFALAVIYGCLSVLSKPMAVSLPLVLWICDWMKGRTFTLGIIFEKIPYFIYIIPIAWLTYQQDINVPPSPLMEGSLTWIWCGTFYIWKFLFPFTLEPLYLRPHPITLLNPEYLIAVLSWILFILICIRFKDQRWLIFAWLFYFCSVFFLFQTNGSHFNVVADRYMYLPSVGFCFLIGFWIHHGMSQLNKTSHLLRNMAVMCLIALFTALSVKTFFQCRVWKNAETVLSAMMNNSGWGEKKPIIMEHISRIYLNRGAALVESGNLDLALEDYNSALVLNSRDYEIYSNRAIIHIRNKAYDAALKDLKQALDINPNVPQVYGNLGLVYLSQEKYDMALDNLNRGLKIDSSSAALYFYRSQTYAHLNRYDEAVLDADKAKALGYQNGAVYFESLKNYVTSLNDP